LKKTGTLVKPIRRKRESPLRVPEMGAEGGAEGVKSKGRVAQIAFFRRKIMHKVAAIC